MPGCTVQCLFVTIETRHLYLKSNSLRASKDGCLGARRRHFGRKKLETLGLKTRSKAGLCARECFITRDLTDDEPDNWIVEGAAIRSTPGRIWSR